MIGTTLGSYRILDKLGEGGMGEVYRAHDSTLRREVALRILPDVFAADPDRLARFEREARVLASLNHPHIAAIYGVEEAAPSTGSGHAVRALVLELVEGPTLAERLRAGALPVREALEVARQIAEALEAAHERGVVHRDLKPANVKLTPDGVVKVLDFGIAKMRAPLEDAAVEASTVTTMGTRPGVVLGTAAYMSPEQARGQAVDKRADIWAFGCVLYELLTGRAAFAGDTLSDTLARVLEREPDWTRLPAEMSAAVRRLVRRCLEKDPKRRLHDIADARLDLDDARDGVREVDDVSSSGRPRGVAMWVAAGLAFTAIAAGVVGWVLKPSDLRTVSRLSHVLPPDVSFGNLARSVIAVAPDGSSIVYAATDRLYRRALDELDAVPIRGTEGSPSVPFFSPDGRTLGYWDAAAGELRRITVAGGTPVSLTRAAALYGANWESDGTIVYGQVDGVWRVSANGGPPEQLVRIEPAELAYGPRMLPDGRSVLFSLVARASMVGQSSAWDTARVIVQSLDTGERKEIVRGGDARVVPTGHLLYALDAVLFAVPFDLARQEVTGGPVAVIDSLQRGIRGRDGQGGAANYDVSRNGTLVYVPNSAFFSDVPRRLLAVDREGNAEPLIDEERAYWRPRISPDGTRVAVEVLTPNLDAQLWIVDLQRRTSTPLGGEQTGYVAWTPDGESVIYRRPDGLYRQAADGSLAAQLLLELPAAGRTMDVSRDGIVASAVGSPQDDIRTLQLEDGTVSDFLATPAREHMASFSLDGRWLAYTSNGSGQDEVYVRPFPRTDGVERLVSIGGGSGPVWAPDGSALYYRGASGDIMAVPTTLDPTFTAGRPQPLWRFHAVFLAVTSVRSFRFASALVQRVSSCLRAACSSGGLGGLASQMLGRPRLYERVELQKVTPSSALATEQVQPELLHGRPVLSDRRVGRRLPAAGHPRPPAQRKPLGGCERLLRTTASRAIPPSWSHQWGPRDWSKDRRPPGAGRGLGQLIQCCPGPAENPNGARHRNCAGKDRQVPPFRSCSPAGIGRESNRTYAALGADGMAEPLKSCRR
jgi:eukaryotic-like serine/threonine-protein kinase